MKNRYTPTDSAKVFLISIVALEIMAFCVNIFCLLVSKSLGIEYKAFLDRKSTIIAVAIISELTFLISFGLLHINNKVNIKKALKINKKYTMVQILIILLIGIIGILGFTEFSNLTNYFLEKMNYNVSEGLVFPLDSFKNFAICTLLYALLPAICEELIFRGVCYNGLSSINSFVAVFFSALMFAVFHMSLQQFIYQFFLGIVFALILKYTHNLLLTMSLHFFNNFFVLFVGFIAYNPNAQPIVRTYETPIEIFLPIFYAMIAIIAIMVLLRTLKSLKQNDEFNVLDLEQENDDKQAQKAYKKDKDTFAKYAFISFIISILLWAITITSNFS